MRTKPITIVRFKKSQACRDEQCVFCAHPFDAGDDMWTDAHNDHVYCSRQCIAKHIRSLLRESDGAR